MLFKGVRGTVEEKLISLYLILIFGVYPLYLIQGKAGPITMKTGLFGFCTACTLAALILLLYRAGAAARRSFNRIDGFMLGWLALAVTKLVIYSVQGRGDYEGYVLTAFSALAYFMLSGLKGGERHFRLWQMDLFLCASLAVTVFLLLRLILLPGMNAPVWILAGDRSAMSSFLLLSIFASMALYCTDREGKKDVLYLAVFLTGSLLLFAQKDILAVWLAGSFFLAIPLLFPPSARLVQRAMLLGFLYYFLLGNMPFLTGDSKLLKTEARYAVTDSMVLNLFLMLGACLLLQYWKRVPSHVPPELVLLRRVQRGCAAALMGTGIVFAALLFIGSTEGIGRSLVVKGAGFSTFLRAASGLRDSVVRADGTFLQAAGDYGILGFLFLAASWTAALLRINKNYKRCANDRKTALLSGISVLFFIQSLFCRQQGVTTPVYVAFVTYALMDGGRKGGINAYYSGDGLPECGRLYCQDHPFCPGSKECGNRIPD